MKTMTERTTFALDKCTAKRLRKLSNAWHVSQAEVVRRAVAMAEGALLESVDASEPLRTLHASGNTIVRETAEAYLAEMEEARRNWRGGV